MRFQKSLPIWGLALVLSVSVSCSSGGKSSSVPLSGSDLNVESISVVNNAEWKINRAIDIEFDQPINFATVTGNTIQLMDAGGVSATGVFLQPLDLLGNVQANVVRFQPNCPTEDDFSDAGLSINTSYQLRVLGANDTQSGITVQSTSGGVLQVGQVVDFATPNSTLPETLFLDTVPGSPTVRVRGVAGISDTETEATYLELGGDSSNRRYFGADGLGTDVGTGMAYQIPLNKYSDIDSQIAVMLYMNQPVLASTENVNSDRIRFEYFDDLSSSWLPMPTSVELALNCVESGSILRVLPLGLVPQGSAVRLVVRQGFVDLTGDPTPQDNTTFAVMESRAALDGGLAVDDADELLEDFILQGAAEGSLEDITTPLGDPRANWGAQGTLEASFDFGGTGGPGGNFDFHIPDGETISINTTTASIVGGPGGAPVASQTVINGVLDIRDLYVPENSRLVFVGPTPATILASGQVLIEGEVSANGGNNDGVGTLNTTFQPEPGAAGNAGGGKGGTGSFLTSQSTPRGGTGNGAFNEAGKGGQGGETGYSTGGTDQRRGAGGGGGALGKDVFYDHDTGVPDDPLRQCQTLIGMDGEPGFWGALNGTGAVSQTARAIGGDLGPRPFPDSREDNDFLGTLITAGGELITGELEEIWAGAGGGAGGDASSTATFPRIPFLTGGDEKGGGGGGGAGGISILAIGPIIIETTGALSADGGHGGGGENTNFFDRVGGAGGGGSGGHIVLSSASFIDIRNVAELAGEEYRDAANAHRARPVSALGGQGGAGWDDRGGNDADGPTTWRCDSIKLSRLTGIGGSTDVPPLLGASTCFGTTGMPGFNDTEGGPVPAAGGDGTPGIIQMHVDNPGTNLLFTGAGVGETWSTADVTQCTAPPPLGWNGPGLPTDDFVAFFGRLSVAQSEWIPLGLARVAPGANPDDQVRFFFQGTDPFTGSVERSAGGTGSTTANLADIIPSTGLGAVGTVPYVTPDGLTIVMDGSTMPAAYKANPLLIRKFSIVLTDNAGEENFPVLSAMFDTVTEEVSLTVASTDNLRDNFINTAQGNTSAALRPHFFRMKTQGQLDSYPLITDVKILFDAAPLGADGTADESMSFSALSGNPTANASDLNLQVWDFFRFRVIFDLNTTGMGVDPTAPRPALEYVRLPFVY